MSTTQVGGVGSSAPAVCVFSGFFFDGDTGGGADINILYCRTQQERVPLLLELAHPESREQRAAPATTR